MPKLLFISGKKKGYAYRLKENRITIGRDPSNTLFIPDIRISRRHAVLTSQGEGYILEDLGSVNGTRVNGKKLAPHSRTSLSNGDILTLGKLKIQVLIQE